MRKIILDFGGPLSVAALTRRDIHRYIAEQFDFPEYYGNNLDALYDCLTDIAGPTAVGIAIPMLPRSITGQPVPAPGAGGAEDMPERPFDAMKYLMKVRRAFADAENDNPNLAVFDLLMIPRGADRLPMDEDD